MSLVFAAFLAAHGLVFLLYAGHSLRLFELTPGLAWPDGAWTLSRLAGSGAVHVGVASLFTMVALVFVASGAGLAFRQAWWTTAAASTSVVSTVAFLCLWNGQLRRLGDQGIYGVLINVAILVAALVFNWPKVA